MKKIINKGLDYYENEMERVYEKVFDKMRGPVRGPVCNDKDGQIISIPESDISESSIDGRKLAKFLHELDYSEHNPITLVKVVSVKADKDSYKKTDDEIFIEGKVEVFHLGKKEIWDAEDYVLMELGATYALGGELMEFYPDTKKIEEEYGTYENIYVDEYIRKKDFVTIKGKYGLHYQ